MKINCWRGYNKERNEQPKNVIPIVSGKVDLKSIISRSMKEVVRLMAEGIDSTSNPRRFINACSCLKVIG